MELGSVLKGNGIACAAAGVGFKGHRESNTPSVGGYQVLTVAVTRDSVTRHNRVNAMARCCLVVSNIETVLPLCIVASISPLAPPLHNLAVEKLSVKCFKIVASSKHRLVPTIVTVVTE